MKSTDERVDPIETPDRMPALSEQSKTIEEPLCSPRHNIDIGFKLARVVEELGEAVIADMKSEILGRDIFEVVGFIEDDGAVVRKNRGCIGLAYGQIGEKQMMIHHNDIGFHGFLPHERQKATIVVFAFRAQTPVSPRIHACPQLGILAHGAQLGSIAGFRLLSPIEDGLEISKLS